MAGKKGEPRYNDSLSASLMLLRICLCLVLLRIEVRCAWIDAECRYV